MTKLAFTICSNNYLAQAKTLGDSLLAYNPDYRFAICLVDILSDKIDYTFFAPHQIIPVGQIAIPDFESMVLKYDITELNTAVKPFVFEYLFHRNNSTEVITYLDPDIQVYDAFQEIEQAFEQNTFVLTPHYTNAINDDLQLNEESILNCGLYNLGFLGLARKGRVFEFLSWWKKRLKDRCYNRPAKGWFVDQIWINFVPLYYEGAFIMRHPGYNMAYWNLHERILENRAGKYFVNDNFPLVFYHFSGYNISNPAGIAKYQNRFSFENRHDLAPIFNEYRAVVLQNKHEQFCTIPCHYVEMYKAAKAEAEAKMNQLELDRTAAKSSFKRNMKIKLRKILHLDN